MSAEIDREIAEPRDIGNEDTDSDETSAGVTGPENKDLTKGRTPAQEIADDETRAPEQEGGETPRP